MCNGLESVTLLTCLLILTGGETCYYDSETFRCSADVTPIMPCNVIYFIFKFSNLGLINMDVQFWMQIVITTNSV